MQPMKRKAGADWYLAQTKPGAEMTAAANVRRLGFETYLPLVYCERRKRRVAYFSRYLFVKSISGQWHTIETAIGVTRIVRFGESPEKVPNKIIRALRKQENSRGLIGVDPVKLREGDNVRIKQGPFASQVGLFASQMGRRIAVLLSLLGKNVTVHVQANEVERAS